MGNFFRALKNLFGIRSAQVSTIEPLPTLSESRQAKIKRLVKEQKANAKREIARRKADGTWDRSPEDDAYLSKTMANLRSFLKAESDLANNVPNPHKHHPDLSISGGTGCETCRSLEDYPGGLNTDSLIRSRLNDMD